jgi:hypothetical protein
MSVNIIGDVDAAAGAIKGYFRYQLFASFVFHVSQFDPKHVCAELYSCYGFNLLYFKCASLRLRQGRFNFLPNP